MKLVKTLVMNVGTGAAQNIPLVLRQLILFIGAATLGLLGLTACSNSRRSSNEQRYELTGKVVSVDKAEHRVVVAHEEIVGFMDAMTMPFTLKEEEALNLLAPGDRLAATLVVDDERSWLENPAVTKADLSSEDGAASSTAIEPSRGDVVPDLSLVNQDGKPVSLHQYRGKALVVTFIYTRCPLPEYCPLMSTNFAEINRLVQQNPQLRARAHLLSISVDPAYDTPQVLRRYAGKYLGGDQPASFADWEFATGTPQQVQQVAQFFGLSYYSEGDQIVHALRTAVITPEGELLKIYKDNKWNPADVVRDLERLLAASDNTSANIKR